MGTERAGSSKDLWGHLNRGNSLGTKLFSEHSLDVAGPFPRVGIRADGQRQRWGNLAVAWANIKAVASNKAHVHGVLFCQPHTVEMGNAVLFAEECSNDDY